MKTKVRGIMLAILMPLVMLLGFAVMFIGAEQVSALEGDGSASNPYRISTYAELKEFAAIVNGTHTSIMQNTGACAILTDDIECTDETWTSMGSWDAPYTGTFDGKSKTITSLRNKETTTSRYQGLFGITNPEATIQNVGMEDVCFYGYNVIGAVAGRNSGTITNCYNTGTPTATYGYVGGIAGDNYGTISNCHNTGDLSANNYIGGIAGTNSGTITSCYNTGKVSGNQYVGGVVGWNGWNNSGTLSHCYNTGDVSGDTEVGGVTGYNQVNVILTNCYNAGAVSGNSRVGGVTGSDLEGKTTTNCYYDSTICSAARAVGSFDDTDSVKGLPTSEMTGTDCTAYDSWDNFFAIWQLTESYPILAPHDHELTYEEEQEPRSCMRPGHGAGFTCSVCGKHYSDENGKTLIPDKNWDTGIGDHIWNPEWSSDGNKHWHQCTECGEIKDEAAHHWEFEEFFWKGYTSAKAYYVCECDDSRVRRAVATITEETTDPTCTEAGKTTYTATISAESSPDGVMHEESRDAKATKATGHTWDAGKVTKKATTTATGIKTHSCTVCKATKTATIPKLAKKANPLTIKAKTATIKYSAVKKKAQTLAIGKVITFTKKGQGKMTYSKASGNKKIVINKTTGKVTVKKGLKKGTYKVKVKVKAAGNANYKASAVKTVTFKVKVK